MAFILLRPVYFTSPNVMWIDHILFIYSPGDGHLGRLHLLAMVNDVTMNMSLQTSAQHSASSSSGCTPRNGAAGSHGNSICNCLRPCPDLCFFFFKGPLGCSGQPPRGNSGCPLRAKEDETCLGRWLHMEKVSTPEMQIR